MKNKGKSKFFPLGAAFLAAFVLSTALSAPAFASVIGITLNAHSEVEGPYIELGEVAQITGSDEDVAKLVNLRIGIAPPHDHPIMYRKSDLESRLYVEGIAPSEYSLSGPDKITVVRAGLTITSAELASVLDDEIRTNFCDDVKIIWTEHLPDITVNPGELEIIVKYPSHRKGALPQTILVKVDGRLARQFPLTRFSSFKTPMIIAKAGIPRGAVVTLDMIESLTRVVPPGTPVIATIGECLGLESKRNIGAGEQLTYESLIQPYDVRRGDALVVVIMRGSLRIEAPATSSDNGYIGERILVRLDDTGKGIRVTLTAHNLAVVIMPT